MPLNRSMDRRHAPCTARSSRPAAGRRSAAYRTRRPSCPRRWRTGREKVFVDAAENVLGAVLCIAESDGADQVDELAEPLLVERRTGVVLGQHALERRVLLLDRDHRVVNDLADGRLAWHWPADVASGPASAPRRHSRRCIRRGLRGRRPASFSSACAAFLEGVGDVLEEDEAEDDVLVFGGVHVAAHLVGGLPQLLLEPEVRTVTV